ncbi:MAG: hypothetical protein IPK60_00360 [Sandaracinaceae bacterium]|nr:hypothetical protein [Sandaracinaceae bacterium]
MDSKLHSRYLTYLERREYFSRSPENPRLPIEKWVILDRELTKLLAIDPKQVDEETAMQIKALRAALFRD